MEKLDQIEKMDVDLNPNQNQIQNENNEVENEGTMDVAANIIDINDMQNKNIQCLINKIGKQIIKKQVKEQISVQVLSEEVNVISNHIEEYRKTTNYLQLEREKINTKVEQYKEEISGRMQQTVSNCTEIFNELHNFVKTLENKMATSNNECEKFFKNVDEQKNLIENEYTIKKSNVQNLKARLESLKCENAKKEDINNTYSLLKNEIAEKQENLSKYKSNYKEKEAKLSQEIKDLQNELFFRKQNITELENNIKLTVLNMRIDDRENEIDFEKTLQRNLELEKEISDTYKQVAKLQESTKNTQELFEIEMLKFEEKNNKISELEEAIGRDIEDDKKWNEENLSRVDYFQSLLQNCHREFSQYQARNHDKMRNLSELMEKQSRVNQEKLDLNQKLADTEIKVYLAQPKYELLNSELLKEEAQVKNAQRNLEKIEEHPELVELETKKKSLTKTVEARLFIENNLMQLRVKKRKLEEELKQLGDETLSEDQPSTSQKGLVYSVTSYPNQNGFVPRGILKKSPNDSFKNVQFSKVSSTNSSSGDLLENTLKLMIDEDCDET